MKKRMLIAAWLLMQCWLGISAALTLKETGGWFESGYVTWELMEGASSYRVYYRIQDGEYKQLDGSLVRNYGTYGRADVIGIKPGTYQFKIVALDEQENPLAESETESPLFTVCPHDRGGLPISAIRV